jgi:hypothetical protein
MVGQAPPAKSDPNGPSEPPLHNHRDVSNLEVFALLAGGTALVLALLWFKGLLG